MGLVLILFLIAVVGITIVFAGFWNVVIVVVIGGVVFALVSFILRKLFSGRTPTTS